MNENIKTENIKRRFFKKGSGLDLVAKIISFIIALVIWLYAVSVDGPVYEKTFDGINVAVENIPAGLSVISGQGYTVQVKLKGKRSDVLGLSSDDIVAYVDASSVTDAGMTSLPISVVLPENMTLSELYPENISVYLGTTTSKQLPVKISMRNYTIEADHVLEKSTPELSRVTVTGPADELDKIAEARVTLEPGHIRSSFTSSGTVVLYDSNGNIYTNPYVTCSASDILVHIEVLIYKTVPLKISCKYGYYTENNTDITISPETVKLKGPESTLSSIEYINIAAIDETLPPDDEKELSYDIELPEDVTSAEGVKSAAVIIRHKNSSVRSFSVSKANMIVANQPEGKTYQPNTNNLNVKVRGDNTEFFANMTSEDITVLLDLENYSGDSKNIIVPAEIIINKGSEDVIVYAVGSYTVSLSAE